MVNGQMTDWQRVYSKIFTRNVEHQAEAVRIEERERIIKILEDEVQRLVDMAGQREGGPAWRSAGIENCEHLIALIKGENK